MAQRRNGDVPICQRAALHYAGLMGWKLFPARMEAGKKWSWLSAAHAPGGENWGMSNELEQLRKNFNNPRWRLKCGVGLPTGAVNGIFVCEADTIKGHGVDGLKALRALEKQHGKLPKTLMAKSPSGSVHYYFKHPGGDIKLKSMSIAAGVDIKADGGMVIAPPSVRSDGAYKWVNDEEIADAPAWLIELIQETKEAYAEGNGYDPEDPWMNLREPLSEAEKTAGCIAIRDHLTNEDDDWDVWNTKIMKIFRAVPDERGREAAHGYSSRSAKYNERNTDAKWRILPSSPPTHISDGSFVWLANEADPDWRYSAEEENAAPEALKVNGSAPTISTTAPADLWDNFYSPPLPHGLLPKTIEAYAFAYGKQIGCDPIGLAMGALTACAAVIPDRIKVQPLKHSTWTQPARLWVALVGPASVKKTPIFGEVMEPINRIDRKLMQDYMRKKEEWEALEPAERKKTPPPPCMRLKIEDVTIEKAQELFVDSPDGMILTRNELAGWFGSMEKYSGGKGAHTDRGFWLATYDGHGYTLDRVKRGTHYVENLGLSLFGGIQPSVIRKISSIGEDDGLIERLNPVVLRDGTASQDLPIPKQAIAYSDLINELYLLRRTHNGGHIQFTDEARAIREQVEREYQDKAALFQQSNAMFSSHLGKYHGMFVRMCLLWHIIEHYNDAWDTNIEAETAQRVATFMREFLMRHAATFYFNVVDVGDDQEKLRAVGSFILAHKLTEVTSRDVQRGTNSGRGLKRKGIEELFEQLHALGWLIGQVSTPQKRSDSQLKWKVNPAVHAFSERAKIEHARRESLRKQLLEMRSKPDSETKGEHDLH